MNKTNIEWVKNPDGSQGYTWNPVTGCLNHDNGLCKGGGFPCYAYKLANGRLKPLYLANTNWAKEGLPYYKHLEGLPEWTPFYPRFWKERLDQPINDAPLKPCGFFVCDMGELFADWIPKEWTLRIFETIADSPGDRFYLLTKQPQNLIKFSPFPENCWVGVTCTSKRAINHTLPYLMKVGAGVIYLSIEPFLKWDDGSAKITADGLLDAGINWLIIGACTGSLKEMRELRKRYPELTPMPWGERWTAQPRIEWVREIVEAADKAGIRVFLKDNLLELVNYQNPETDFAFNKDGQYRQEMP